MTSVRSRLLSAALAGFLALGSPLAALAAEAEPHPAAEESADLLAITVPNYTPGTGLQAGDVSKVKKGELYTLIVLPRAVSGAPPALTAQLLLASEPLFIGSAVAEADGKVTFTNIRLRTAEAAVYYVTGPGLEGAPLTEATGFSVSIHGEVTGAEDAPVADAAVSLVDTTTGYAYANTVATRNDGSYTLDGISPGSYYLLVKRAGYLPARNKNATIITDDTEYFVDLDISSFLGDVNNDGQRNVSDLTDLLSRYGLPLSAAPGGLTPDLNGDSAVDAEDVSLFLTAAANGNDLTRGVGDGSAASLTARDAAPVKDVNRALTLSLNNGGTKGLTFTAAHVSLTFRTDYVQPLNQSGGMVAPGVTGNAANCLTAKTGVTVEDAAWSVNGDLATLTFSLSCAKPAALTDLVSFHYRPAAGKTLDQFFQGVFTVDHAAAQVGSESVVTGCALEYPNSTPVELDAITIDTLPDEVTIPSTGHTVTLALSATGRKGEELQPGLTGLTWTLNGQTDGVSVSDSLLLISSDAIPGAFTLTASRDNGDHPLTSAPVTITLKNADPVARQLRILRSGAEAGDHTITGVAGEELSFPYAVRVEDQYGNIMDDQTVVWSLSGAPAGIEVAQDGRLTAASSLPGGTYSFALHASLGPLRAAANVTLELETQLHRLVLSGPASVQIPSSDPLTLRYTLSALDAQGNAIPAPALEAGGFTVVRGEDEPAETTGVTSDIDFNGNLTVTVDNGAQSGNYRLRATSGNVYGELTLTLLPPEEGSSVPVRAALLHKGTVAESLALTTTHGEANAAKLSPVLLSADGAQLSADGLTWTWAVSGLPAGEETGAPTYTTADGGLEWKLDQARPGEYFCTVTVTETASRLSAAIPVHITILPKVTALTLSAPDRLSIPTSGSLEYPVGVTALDADGASVALPNSLRWSVTDENEKAPAGVTLKSGVLTVSPSAKPGKLTLSVWLPKADGAKDCLSTKEFTLEPTDTEKVLTLRRGGELLSGGVDAIYGKEGSQLSLTYTPVLLDRATGAVTELTQGVSWLGASGSFTLNSNTEPGLYTTPITAVYDGQSVSLTAQITVYPNIKDLFILFDEGDSDPIADRYSFPVPTLAPKTYHGTMMAQITRGGKTVNRPLLDLGLTEYDIDVYTPLTGVYLAYDRSTGRVALTIEPIANSNSMKDPGENDATIRYIGIDFGYYPNEDPLEKTKFFFLTKEDSVVSSAVLRQGSGLSPNFVFETAQEDTTLDTAPGVLSDCFALELLDQYGSPVTSKSVTWKLEGSPQSGSTNLVTIIDPGSAVTGSYPRYQSIRRLRIAPETPEGVYHLTLSASAEGFTRSIAVTLNVSGQQTLDAVTLTGPDAAVIPKWFVKYNSSETNNETRTLSYVAVAQDPNGHEIDSSLCEFVWAVTDEAGKTVKGVSIKSNKDNAASATVTIDRNAEPTTKNPLQVTVTATPKGDGEPLDSSAPLTLTQGSLVPTLMTIKGPTSIKLDLPKADPNKPDAKPVYQNASETYTFELVNQYNDPVSERDAQSVDWSWDAKKVPSYVTIEKETDAKGHRYVVLKVQNPKTDLRTTVTLTAQITFPEASTTSGKAVVFKNLPITITVGNPPSGGGSLGGGDILEPEVTDSTVTPSTSKTGTTGTSTLSTTDVDTLSQTTATGVLTIAPKNTSGLTSITVTFPGSLVKTLRAKTQNNSLRIQTAIGTVTIPKAVLASFSNSGNVSITIRNQDNTLAVTFTSNGRQLTSLTGGSATFSAPVNAAIVTAVKGGVSEDVLKKSVITNGTLTVALTGSAELTVGAAQPEVVSKVFSDTSNHWAKDAISFVAGRGLFQGTSETTFSPNGDMTRGMVVTVLYRLESTPAVSASNVFRDVPNGVWFTDAVVWANSHGIVQGNGDGFLPNDPVTREQLATILYRYMKDQGLDVSKRSSLAAFSDSSRVSPWAADAMQWAVATGLINGKSGGVLDPGGKASRAEVATMLERLITNLLPQD